MLKFVDCNMSVGVPNAPVGWRVYNPKEIKEEAERVGIVHGFAYHNGVLEVHPSVGNGAMDIIAKEYPFYSSVWAVMPNHTGEFYNADVLERMLIKEKVEMVRMFPQYNSHSFSLSDWCMGEMFDMLEHLGIPVLLDQEQVEMEVIHRICYEHPQLKIIITNMNYRLTRDIIALIKKHDNLYVESSGMKTFGFLQTICEQVGAKRVVFGSNLGVYSAGSAVCLVTYALISSKEKEQIAHGTLENLLGRQVI